MGWYHPNPIYCYPRRKRRKECEECIYRKGNACYQRKYQEYDYAELEGYTDVKCRYFKKATLTKCPRCNSKIEDDDNFCAECGKLIKNVRTKKLFGVNKKDKKSDIKKVKAKCPICNENFEYDINFKKIREGKKRDIVEIECPFCETHLRITALSEWVCNNCSKIFRTKEEAEKHKKKCKKKEKSKKNG